MAKIIHCFGGPHGSGKTSIERNFNQINGRTPTEPYLINAYYLYNEFYYVKDPKDKHMAATLLAESIRDRAVEAGAPFMFEALLNEITGVCNRLDFLKNAQKKGYEIVTVYVLTRDVKINLERAHLRAMQGKHPAIPTKQVVGVYNNCMAVLPDVIHASDKIFIYDNTLDRSVTNAPKLMFYKEKGSAIAFAPNPHEDKFLQNTIVKPLQNRFGYDVKYSDVPDNLNIFSEEQLSAFCRKIGNGQAPKGKLPK